MAGDWIKMRHGLAEDPAVIAIAEDTGLDEFAVVGRLHRLWSWADTQTRDGNASSVTETWLDRYVGVSGFAKAMEKAGWLIITSGGVSIPNFDRHISESAKQRALAANRGQKHRNAKRNASSVTKALPEKRREETIDSSNDESCLPENLEDRPRLSFPLSGGKVWNLPAKKWAEYEATYAHRFDLTHELRKARTWLVDNQPRRPKTGRGLASFLTRWLNRKDEATGSNGKPDADQQLKLLN